MMPEVVREDEIAWWIKCDGGCGTVITVPKKTMTPGGEVSIADKPGARRCIACGPFPTRR